MQRLHRVERSRQHLLCVLIVIYKVPPIKRPHSGWMPPSTDSALKIDCSSTLISNTILFETTTKVRLEQPQGKHTAIQIYFTVTSQPLELKTQNNCGNNTRLQTPEELQASTPGDHITLFTPCFTKKIITLNDIDQYNAPS